MRFAHEAQVIPVRSSSTLPSPDADPGGLVVVVGVVGSVVELISVLLLVRPRSAAVAWLVGGRGVEDEVRGTDDAVVPEVEVQVVAAGAGHLRLELDLGTCRRLAVTGRPAGVDVEVGAVSLAERDQ